LIPFSIEAKRNFDRVASSHGLSFVSADERRVRYEGNDVFLNVNFDNGRSFELCIEIGLRIQGGTVPPSSLAEILRLRNVSSGANVDGLMVSNTTKLTGCLCLLADLTLRHADDFLSGSALSFAQVAKLREKEIITHAIHRELSYARARAEQAWRIKNYAAVVAALEPVKFHLSPSEVKRLDYSRGKMKAG
jgi:hypothetical protein